MRDTLRQILDDNQERLLPVPIPREARPREMAGKATAVLGMRRVGKTWFCYQRMRELLEAGTARERLLYLNFEDDRLLAFGASDFQAVLDVYYARFPGLKDQRCHLFLDEAQRIEGWEMFVRRVLDTENMTVWVTGSSSKLLSKEIATSLRGRSLTVEIFPLSFREYLRFHGDRIPAANVGSQARAILLNRMEDYLGRGGFPELQSVEDEVTRRQVLRNHLDVVVLRDVVERHGVSNLEALRRLIGHVTSNPATRFSVNKFYNDLRSQGVSCTKDALYEYLDHLTDAYVVHQVPIHSRSERVRRVNPRKVYVADSGLIASGSGQEDRGARLENAVHAHVRSQGHLPKYVVTAEGAEVDFLLPGDPPRLIQVCWSLEDPATSAREVNALRSAMDQLGLQRGTVVTWSESGEPAPGIEAVPAWEWFLQGG